MKNLKSIALALVVVLSTVAGTAQTKKIDVSKSTIEWVGKKVTGQHNGTVNFSEGAIVLKGNKIVGGSFTVDMTSLIATDLTGKSQEKLNGHLKADDFFGTSNFPTATLVFKTIGEKSKGVYTVGADLTIKGITKPIVFELEANSSSAKTKFLVDRTLYDIKYGSKSFFESIGDKAIDNDFELTVALKF